MSNRKSNKIAKDLRTPKYRKRIEKKRKGKGSFQRNKKANQNEC